MRPVWIHLAAMNLTEPSLPELMYGFQFSFPEVPPSIAFFTREFA
jgi:hypothetical protein